MKIHRIIFWILLSFCLTIYAQTSKQANYFIIEPIAKDAYSIPLIKSDSHPEIADKINQVIQMKTIRTLYNIVGENKLFDKMRTEDFYCTALYYDILLNSEAILSIRFNDETFSIYPDYHTYYFNFNSTTGDIIDISELFTKQGIDHLNDLASTHFNQNIKDVYDETIKDTSLDNATKKEIIESIFKLTECNATHKIWKFGITSDALIVEKDRCFPHAMQALDIGWATTIQIKDFWRGDFKVYGKKLLEEKIADHSLHYNEKEEEMVLHGKIDGKYSFCMSLRINDDNSIYGSYWYKKNGNLIDLKGKNIPNNKIVITEDNGKFDLTLNENGSISGNWINNRGKAFPIKFE